MVDVRFDSEIRFAASPPRASGIPTRPYEPTVTTTKAATIEVNETSVGTLLPVFCPQRHMNPDSTFCLGLKAGIALVDVESAKAWWTKLSVFLTCQDTAAETRTWPPGIEISHGKRVKLKSSPKGKPSDSTCWPNISKLFEKTRVR